MSLLVYMKKETVKCHQQVICGLRLAMIAVTGTWININFEMTEGVLGFRESIRKLILLNHFTVSWHLENLLNNNHLPSISLSCSAITHVTSNGTFIPELVRTIADSGIENGFIVEDWIHCLSQIISLAAKAALEFIKMNIEMVFWNVKNSGIK